HTTFNMTVQLAEKGDLVLLENLVKKNPEVLSEKDECGAIPLHHAAAGGHVTLIQFINTVIDSQALNSCDDQGNVPLHWAVERNKAESCRALLDLGANPNVLNLALLSPLHLAINLRHNGLVGLLLSYSVTDCNLRGDLGNTPVMLACSINNCEALSTLIKHGAKLCQQNKLGHFAIHAAAFAGARKAMEVILKSGEEVGHTILGHINYLDKSNSSPLHLAVRGGNIDTIRLCIATGAKIDQQQVPNDKSTPLHLACTQGATEVVKLMLSSVDHVEDVINLTDGAHQTPLHRATIFDHTELVEYLISLGADLNSVDCKGNTPLLQATSCGAWKTVILLLSKGANVSVKDNSGCNFLHLALLQPKGLKNLPEEVLQHDSVKALVSCEDNEGCTPLHYACRLGIHDSVKNMLGLSGQVGLACKSKDKKSALHFAAQYGRINTCQRLLETITDSRVLNEGDERGLTPLHLASKEGHTKVVQLLLRKGALFHREVIFFRSPLPCLICVVSTGHTAAVKLLLSRGAEINLNKSNTSFLHEALQNGRKEVVIAVVESDRCSEALQMFKPGSNQRCPILDMIEFLPESYKVCRQKEIIFVFQIKYDFIWLQPPLAIMKSKDETIRPKPLIALNAMVEYNRIELLNHPVCKKYLAMKWIAYGSKAHLVNMFMYMLGLLPLTHVVVTLRPSVNFTNETGERDIMMVIFLSFCMMMVFVMNIYSIVKEVIQLWQQRWNYFKDYSNHSDWLSAIFSLLFIVPLMMNAQGSWYWQAGALGVFNSWVAFLLFLQRFEGVGIYVVMFGEIMRTLVRVIMLFTFLLFSFSLTFHALMINQREFDTVPLAMMQTFVMMVGELNYENNFLDAYLSNQLPFSYLTYYTFVTFVMIMPILLVNLMIGLAVGDIAEVQRNASLKRIGMQIDLHTALEDKLPYWFMKRVDKPSVTIYPNRKCSRVLCGKKKPIFSFLLHEQPLVVTFILNLLYLERLPFLCRMKEMSNQLEKQHSLLKLIIQKMEITTEADENDGPVNVRGGSLWPRNKAHHLTNS
uniref:Transient receptor potential cation channel, subfamily A, member 1b n=1 Tax=Salarias fasciatus TaxID=181472 RepID=A0A672JFM3_SALFA